MTYDFEEEFQKGIRKKKSNNNKRESLERAKKAWQKVKGNKNC